MGMQSFRQRELRHRGHDMPTLRTDHAKDFYFHVRSTHSDTPATHNRASVIIATTESHIRA